MCHVSSFLEVFVFDVFFSRHVIKYITFYSYKVDFSPDKYILQTEPNGRNFLSKNKPRLSVEAVLVTKHSPFHLQSSVQTLNNGIVFIRAVKYVLKFQMKDGKLRREGK